MINSTALRNETIEISIIIVSYNTIDQIGVCLESIRADQDCSKEVFVIDNASTDGSVDLLRRNYPWVHLIANKENRGFAAANNQVLPRCQGRYILFLNPDTKVEPGSLRKFISFMEANPHIGLAGSKVIYPDGSLQESVSYRYPGQRYATHELSGLKGSIACVLGASMIARAEIVRQAGGFDEDFFLYGEDQDLCLRIRKAGYEIGYCDAAVVVHLGGQSERKSTSEELFRKKTQAEYLFYKKHYLPQTTEWLRRTELLKAYWRIATLKLSLPFVRNKNKASEKLTKYQVLYEESKRFRYEKYLLKNTREKGYKTPEESIEKTYYLNRLIHGGTFRFDKLILKSIDNNPILQNNSPRMTEEETCLFHRYIDNGDKYFEILHQIIKEALFERKGIPVVRFADGEYAFYQYSRKCNGLYQQAESTAAIQKAMPIHFEALQILATSGMLAPLIFPGNTKQGKSSLFSFWKKFKMDSSATKFVDFLFSHGLELNQHNYIPFYVVYAYLTSEHFARLVDKKCVCLVTSECHMDSCQRWFARFSSCPTLTFVDIPDSYVATRWSSIKEMVLKRMPPDAELCLVGAGVGALLVCVDIARRFLIPAIDAGHVLNMMNEREDKSRGSRLYTFRKNPERKDL